MPRVDRITYDEARADLVAYYKTSGDRDLSEAGARLKHLDDQRVPDVCAHELRARELHARRLEVDAEDLTDVGILL